MQDNQFVREGELLFRLRKDRFVLALNESEAELASSRISVKQLKSNFESLEREFLLFKRNVLHLLQVKFNDDMELLIPNTNTWLGKYNFG